MRLIGDLPSVATSVGAENALLAVAQVDTDADAHSAAMSRFMIRTESVASSKIERITASAVDFAKALAGNRSNSSATSMVAARAALHNLVTVIADRGVFELEDILEAHRALMTDDPSEARYAGRLRDMQNWIGGMAAGEIERRAGSSEQQAYKAIARLSTAGIIQEITGRTRDRVWVAAELLAELEDLDRRIRLAMEG